MDSEQQFKRNIAYKLKVGDILTGKQILNQEKFQFLELGNKKIVRVNVIGNIVDKYQSEGEKKYLFLTLDDGSGQIQIRIFGDDVEKFKEVHSGETILIIGVIRCWNNNTYLSPEIIKEQPPKYLLVRKLELEKQGLEFQENKTLGPNGVSQRDTQGGHENLQAGDFIKPSSGVKEQIKESKDKILEMIKNSEKDGGIETNKLIAEIKDVSLEIINQEIQSLLEKGMIFEPRPGKVRYLG